MSQCEYTKPHPKHHWWIDGSTTPITNYQQCEGVKDPSPPDGFDYDTHTSHPQFSKQALGEFELWLRGKTQSPAGKMHLHFLYLRGHWEWVVRPGGSSPLCKTPRCRAVTIKEVARATKQDV